MVGPMYKSSPWYELNVAGLRSLLVGIGLIQLCHVREGKRRASNTSAVLHPRLHETTYILAARSKSEFLRYYCLLAKANPQTLVWHPTPTPDSRKVRSR